MNNAMEMFALFPIRTGIKSKVDMLGQEALCYTERKNLPNWCNLVSIKDQIIL